jgi:hypothetical protein
MGVDVHEARADHLTAGINLPPTFRLAQVAYRGNPLALDSHIGGEPFGAAPVNEKTASDEEVKHF